MIERTVPWMMIAVLAVTSACMPNEKGAGADRTGAETEAVRSEAATGLAEASVLIVHRVAEYDRWKRVFDDHAEARKNASCLGHYLKRGVDDPEMVYIYCLATDGDKLRAFLDSADLAETMQSAGVQGEPTIITMKPMSRNLVGDQLLPGIIVMHAVESYDAWRAAYDEFDEFRRKSGVVGHAVTQEFGNPNHVVVYHQANGVAELRTFVDSAEFEDAMRRAGVVGDPDIRFIQVVAFADY